MPCGWLHYFYLLICCSYECECFLKLTISFYIIWCAHFPIESFVANMITYFGTFYSKICNWPYGSGSRCDYTLTTHCDHSLSYSILHDVNLWINLTPAQCHCVGVVNSPQGRRKDTCCIQQNVFSGRLVFGQFTVMLSSDDCKSQVYLLLSLNVQKFCEAKTRNN